MFCGGLVVGFAAALLSLFCSLSLGDGAFAADCEAGAADPFHIADNESTGLEGGNKDLFLRVCPRSAVRIAILEFRFKASLQYQAARETLWSSDGAGGGKHSTGHRAGR